MCFDFIHLAQEMYQCWAVVNMVNMAVKHPASMQSIQFLALFLPERIVFNS
jgi:hypothetical protein